MRDSLPAIVDVLIIIDAETLLAAYPAGTAAHPTSVDQPLIQLVVRQANGVFGEGTKELKLTAETEDVIRWRETTTSLDGRYTGMLYKFFALRGAALISPPQPLVATVRTPLPDPADPLHPTSQTIASYFWTTTVLSPGETTYAFQFAVMDRAGHALGYFSWDPFIKITT
jgi:hypothetical protein